VPIHIREVVGKCVVGVSRFQIDRRAYFFDVFLCDKLRNDKASLNGGMADLLGIKFTNLFPKSSMTARANH